MHPPEPRPGGHRAALDPDPGGRGEAEVHEVHRDGDPETGITALPWPQPRHRHRQQREHEHHHRQTDPPRELGARLEVATGGELRSRHRLDVEAARPGVRQPHGDDILLEAHTADLGGPRTTLVALTIEQRQGVERAIRRDLMPRAVGERDLVDTVPHPLHEHLLESPVGALGLGVEHRGAATEAAELAGGDGRELACAQRLAAQLLHAARGVGLRPQGEPSDAAGDQQREQRDGCVDAPG